VCVIIIIIITIRDVNKDSGFKAKARTKDLSIFNTKDRTKDFCL